MHRRTWDAKTQARIVTEGLKGKPMADICHEHQSSQSQSYEGSDQFLAHAVNAFKVHQHTHTEARLEHEHATLKKSVGNSCCNEKKRRGAGRSRPPAPVVAQRSESLLQRVREL